MRASLAVVVGVLGCAAATPHSPAPSASTACTNIDGDLRVRRERAVADGLSYLRDYLASERRLQDIGVDSVQLFLEFARTSASPALRAHASTISRAHARRLLPRYLAPGGVESARDFSAALDMLLDAGDLGIETDRLDAVVRRRFARFATDAELYGMPLASGDALDDEQLFDLMLEAYTLERARRAIPGVFRSAFDLEHALGLVWTRPLVPRGTGIEAAPHAEENAYLATHVTLVLGDYGRAPLAAGVLGRFERYLRAELRAYLATGDIELVAEIADTLRQLGETDARHAPLCQATLFLLSARNDDGSWGRLRADADTYDAIHPTWAALTGLVERAAPRESAFSQHVQTIAERVAR